MVALPLEAEEDIMDLQEEEEAILQLRRVQLVEVSEEVEDLLEELLARAGQEAAPGLVMEPREDMEVEVVGDMQEEQVNMAAVEEAMLALRILAKAVLEEEEEAAVLGVAEGQASLAAAAALVQVREVMLQEDLLARMPQRPKAAMERL